MIFLFLSDHFEDFVGNGLQSGETRHKETGLNAMAALQATGDNDSLGMQ